MTAMISDFSTVLLDIRDRNILSTKPVDKMTISTAKALHICSYLFLLTTAVVAIPFIVGIFRHGLMFSVLFLLNIVLIDILVVVLTALLYILILRLFDGEKLKDIINYVQIGLSITMVVGYQILARAFNVVNVDITFNPVWWHVFIPPMWFASPFELVLGQNDDQVFVIFTVIAVAVPIAALLVYIRSMSAFEINLQKLANHAVSKEPKQKTGKVGLLKLVCASKEERAFFRFASYMMKNEREFRLKVYPSLGFSLVFPFIFIFNQLQVESLAEIATGKLYLSLYFCFIMIPTAVMMLKYSGTYKGSWIYKTIPINDLEPLYKGTLKAFIIKLHIPIYVVLSAIFIWLFGFRIVPDVIAILLGSCVYIAICFTILKGSLPFSEPFDTAQQKEGWLTLPYMILIGVFAIVHFLATLYDYGVYIYLIILLIANTIAWKKLFKVTW
ncbi:hypothetical protein [Salinibacillus xinjiangensis]|nr:hypothetical protein [Salinibacillus xinjiangensis]